MTDKSLDNLQSAFNVLLDISNIEVDEVEMNYRATIHSTERERIVISAVILVIILWVW